MAVVSPRLAVEVEELGVLDEAWDRAWTQSFTAQRPRTERCRAPFHPLEVVKCRGSVM